MKILTVRVPDVLAAEIAAEARTRNISMSKVVRERLQAARPRPELPVSFQSIRDLIGSVDGLPADLSRRKKKYLTAGRNRRQLPT